MISLLFLILLILPVSWADYRSFFSTPKFFIGIYAYCNGDKHGAWTGGLCADTTFAQRCGTYRKFWATHNFERGYRLESARDIRAHYDLDCALGYKLEDGRTFHGLSCAGSKCDLEDHPVGAPKDRCGYEMRMAYSMPPGVPDTVAITGRLGCINEAGAWIPMPEAIITLWEEDYGFFELNGASLAGNLKKK
ncbi:hypothetical protein PRIPAC_84514 [Pristionchus pacificus]|uniref:Uncharacterized protein n=1 Tax=Pristionchus pacificus TaxID=54126 RepID=A0A2A6BTY4_PRIPA|nr:hypothetical protein PRIPAC_84514 [Pristionchus pacificus]|eukprot:PDM69389.1 hypothetical protein PRIPAC_47691 [Pristionchus pacificus]